MHGRKHHPAGGACIWPCAKQCQQFQELVDPAFYAELERMDMEEAADDEARRTGRSILLRAVQHLKYQHGVLAEYNAITLLQALAEAKVGAMSGRTAVRWLAAQGPQCQQKR